MNSGFLGELSYNTAGGATAMFWVRLRTPFGPRKRLASSACHIMIIPECEFQRSGYDKASRSILYDDGNFVPYCSTQVAPILRRL